MISWDDDNSRVGRAEDIAVRLKSDVDLSQVKTAMEYGSGTGLISFALKEPRESTMFRSTFIQDGFCQ